MSLIKKLSECTVYESPESARPRLNARFPGIVQLPSGRLLAMYVLVEKIDETIAKTHLSYSDDLAESSEPILASQMVSFYRQLYDVEERAKSLDAAGRLALRSRDAVPIWERMARWLEMDQVKRVLPKSAMGEAIGYLRNQWTALQVYLSDGRLPIDNDQSEQTIRPLTVGRNNWLFLGHPRADSSRTRCR